MWQNIWRHCQPERQSRPSNDGMTRTHTMDLHGLCICIEGYHSIHAVIAHIETMIFWNQKLNKLNSKQPPPQTPPPPPDFLFFAFSMPPRAVLWRSIIQKSQNMKTFVNTALTPAHVPVPLANGRALWKQSCLTSCMPTRASPPSKEKI